MSLDQDGVINEVALVDEASVLPQQGHPPRVNHTRNERPGAAGIGSYAVRGAASLDYPAIGGVTIVGSIAFLLANLMTDIAYAWANPRIKVGG